MTVQVTGGEQDEISPSNLKFLCGVHTKFDGGLVWSLQIMIETTTNPIEFIFKHL
jgi:hypothetical protein